MKVFVIGGTGYLGRAVVERLLADGHTVMGLARSDEAAARLAECGAAAVRGDLSDLGVLDSAARAADAVVQVSLGGFLTQLEGDGARRLALAVQTLARAIEGSAKPYIFTSGAGIYGDTGVVDPERRATETDPIGPPYYYAHLADIERAVLAAAGGGLRTVVLRVGQVYGRGGGYIGPVARRFASARRNGLVNVIEAWGRASYVHVDDVAALFALALHRAPPGSLFNGAGESVTALDMARAVSRVAGFGGEIRPLSPQAFRDADGWPSTLDFLWSVQVDSQKARDLLGWTPVCRGLLAELDALAGADISAIYPAPRYLGAAPSTMPGQNH
jgi:nucleoside-diphosphate-sugar epimerase